MSTGSDARADALIAKATAFRLTENAERIALRACRKAGLPAAQASSVAAAVRAGISGFTLSCRPITASTATSVVVRPINGNAAALTPGIRCPSLKATPLPDLIAALIKGSAKCFGRKAMRVGAILPILQTASGLASLS